MKLLRALFVLLLLSINNLEASKRCRGRSASPGKKEKERKVPLHLVNESVVERNNYAIYLDDQKFVITRGRKVLLDATASRIFLGYYMGEDGNKIIVWFIDGACEKYAESYKSGKSALKDKNQEKYKAFLATHKIKEDAISDSAVHMVNPMVDFVVFGLKHKGDAFNVLAEVMISPLGLCLSPYESESAQGDIVELLGLLSDILGTEVTLGNYKQKCFCGGLPICNEGETGKGKKAGRVRFRSFDSIVEAHDDGYVCDASSTKLGGALLLKVHEETTLP